MFNPFKRKERIIKEEKDLPVPTPKIVDERKVPTFYKREMAYSAFDMFTKGIAFFVITILTIALMVYTHWLNPQEQWLKVMSYIVCGILICFTGTRFLIAVFHNKTVKLNKVYDNTLTPVCLLKQYRKLHTAHINANWFCCLAYLWTGVIFLTLFCVDSLHDFGSGEHYFKLAEIICAVIFGWVMLNHLVTIITAAMRIEDIDNFYKKEIVPNEEIQKIKKSANIRDAILFVIGTIILIFLVFKFVKKVPKPI